MVFEENGRLQRVRTSIVCVHNQMLLGFYAEDPKTYEKFFFLPGGAIEPEETAPEAAEREALEETGYQVYVNEKSCIDKEYNFKWNGQIFDCLTLFYKAELTSPMAKAVDDAPYHRGVHWLPLSQIKQAFAYSEDILSAVEELIKIN